jgi:hypothetical protein
MVPWSGRVRRPAPGADEAVNALALFEVELDTPQRLQQRVRLTSQAHGISRRRLLHLNSCVGQADGAAVCLCTHLV